MKQNNRSTKLKAIVAVILVMAALFAMASLVSAGFVEEVFKEICDGVMASSSNSGHTHTESCYKAFESYCTIAEWIGDYPVCSKGYARCHGGQHVEDTWYVLTCGK